MKAREVIIAPSALEAILDIGAKDERRRLRNRLAALELFPRLGASYDPVYESARLPHNLLVTFVGHHGIYYSYDEAAGVVNVEYVEDCRRDPMGKFSR